MMNEHVVKYIEIEADMFHLLCSNSNLTKKLEFQLNGKQGASKRGKGIISTSGISAIQQTIL